MAKRTGTTFVLLLAALLMAAPARAQQAQEPAAAPAGDPEGPPVSARGAFVRSLLLPGWGQAYAGAPGRGSVYFGLASGSAWMTYVARRQLAEARREQAWLRETGALLPTQETEFALARARQVEDWTALTIFLFFFAGADAYVAAYLADFDERIGVLPTPEGGMRFQVTLPLGRR